MIERERESSDSLRPRIIDSTRLCAREYFSIKTFPNKIKSTIIYILVKCLTISWLLLLETDLFNKCLIIINWLVLLEILLFIILKIIIFWMKCLTISWLLLLERIYLINAWSYKLTPTTFFFVRERQFPVKLANGHQHKARLIHPPYSPHKCLQIVNRVMRDCCCVECTHTHIRDATELHRRRGQIHTHGRMLFRRGGGVGSRLTRESRTHARETR